MSVTAVQSTASTPAASTPAAGGPAPGDSASSARAFLQDLAAALHNLTTLKIVTVVGDVSVGGSGMDVTVTPQNGGSVEAASTEIDMFNAHIANVFSPKFSSAGDGQLYKFHQDQVAASTTLFNQHLSALQGLATSLVAMRR